MIIDSLPEVQGLSPEQKWKLAEELWDELIPEKISDRDDAIEELINQRMRHYKEHPETASSWEAVKSRLNALKHG